MTLPVYARTHLMNTRFALHRQLADGVAALGFALPGQVMEQLLDYLVLLTRWNAVYNLTAVRDQAQMISRHLLDALAILPFVRGETLVDLGTGPGVPGIVLALAAPQRQILLVDANGKKVRFLKEVIRMLKLRTVRAVQVRVEQMDGCFDCVTTRAFASLADMLRMGGHLLAPAGIWLAMKGPRVTDELADVPAGFVLHCMHPLTVPGLKAQRQLVVLARDDSPQASV